MAKNFWMKDCCWCSTLRNFYPLLNIPSDSILKLSDYTFQNGINSRRKYRDAAIKVVLKDRNFILTLVGP